MDGFQRLDFSPEGIESARLELEAWRTMERQPGSPWRYRPDNLTLEHDGRGHYYVDLERCQDAAAVLDWIAQVSQKTFMTPEDVGWLVRDLDRVLDLQGTRCGNGMWGAK